MRVDEHLIVETVDRVVQRSRMEVDPRPGVLDLLGMRLRPQLLVVRQHVPDLASHGVTDTLVGSALSDVRAVRLTQQDLDPGPRFGLDAKSLDPPRVLLYQ